MWRKRSGWIWCAAVLIAVGGTATFLVHKAWWDSDDIPSLQDAIENDQGFDGTDEYDPAGDDHYNLPPKAPRVQILTSDGSQEAKKILNIDISKWTAEEHIVAVRTREPMRVALRLLNYPAWRVELFHEMKSTPQEVEESGQMVIPLPAGISSIRVHFVRTPDRTWGMVISVVAVLILLTLINAGGQRLLSASP